MPNFFKTDTAAYVEGKTILDDFTNGSRFYKVSQKQFQSEWHCSLNSTMIILFVKMLSYGRHVQIDFKIDLNQMDRSVQKSSMCFLKKPIQKTFMAGLKS